MSIDPKFDEAKVLIDVFAAQLLALNDGKAIPPPWQICLKKALTPKPGKAGRKYDYAKVSETMKYIILCAGELKKERTKHFSPTKYKDMIAKKAGIKRKTVERYMKFVMEIFCAPAWDSEKNIKQNLSLISNYFTRMKGEPPELREAIRKAFNKALIASYPAIKAELESAEVERMRRIESRPPQ